MEQESSEGNEKHQHIPFKDIKTNIIFDSCCTIQFHNLIVIEE